MYLQEKSFYTHLWYLGGNRPSEWFCVVASLTVARWRSSETRQTNRPYFGQPGVYPKHRRTHVRTRPFTKQFEDRFYSIRTVMTRLFGKKYEKILERKAMSPP